MGGHWVVDWIGVRVDIRVGVGVCVGFWFGLDVAAHVGRWVDGQVYIL